jgi:hypothetical protein
MDYGTIYVLLDPRTEMPRYVGQTVCSLSKRVAEHMSEPSDDSPRSKWIRELRREGLSATIVAIAEADSQEQLDELEGWHIRVGREIGLPLLNRKRGPKSEPDEAISDIVLTIHVGLDLDSAKALERLEATLVGPKRGRTSTIVRNALHQAAAKLKT